MTKTSNKLTAAKLKGLKNGQSVYGSNLKATKNKNGITFYASFAINGERHLKRLGTDTNINLTDAIKNAASHRVEQERQHSLVANGDAESDITIVEAFSYYMTHLKLKSGVNFIQKEQHFRLHIRPFFSDMQVRKVKSSIIIKFQEELFKKDLSKSTIKRIMSTLNNFYKYCKLMDWVHSRPYEYEPIKEDTKSRRPITQEMQNAMLAEAKKSHQHPLIYIFMRIGFGVGMRHQEILSIRWEDIDWAKMEVFLHKTKTGERQQKLTSQIIDDLRMLQQETNAESGYVFSSTKSKSGKISRMDRPFRNVCKAVGASEEYTPHFMRHTCVTELVGAGYSDRIVASITGHKTPVMISRYTHLKDIQAKAVAEIQNTRT